MSGCATGSLPRRAGIRWRCWSSPVGWRPPSWRAGSGSRSSRFPLASRTASSGGWRRFPRRPAGSCWSRRRSRSANRPWSGAPPLGSASGSRPARRAERALAAARAQAQAGAFDAALRLLATAEAGPLDELRRAQADLLRGQIAFAVNRGSDAPPLLLAAAKRLEPLDVGLARETYLDALQAAMFVGRLATSGGLLEVAQAAREAPLSSQPPRAADLLLAGLARQIT